MFKNLINRQDLYHLINGLRTGSVWRTLKRLLEGSTSAVEETWTPVAGPPSYFWNIPDIVRRANRMMTGDADLDYITYISDKYLEPLQPLHGLSLGCGAGRKELDWASRCCYTRLDAYDISASRIAHARSQAQVAGHTEICYQTENIQQMEWPTNAYNIVIFDQSLHHFTPLEPLLKRVHQTLKPTGYLVVSEFVGPTRFQWTDRQLEVINGTLSLLPEPYRRRWSDGRIKRRVHRPSRLSMILSDPSEAVESGHILPLLERHFEIVERRDYGGTILHMLFDDIAANFLRVDGKVKDDEAQRLLDMCFQIEDTLLAVGNIPSDFALLICQRRPE